MIDAALDTDFTSTLDLKASPDKVLQALTSPTNIVGWWTSWTSITGAGHAGGELRFFDNEDGDEAVQLTLQVEKAERTLVQWKVLNCAAASDWTGTTIEFKISESPSGGSRVDFRHHGLTPQLECFTMCHRGWTKYLASLTDYVNSGQGSPSKTAHS